VVVVMVDDLPPAARAGPGLLCPAVAVAEADGGGGGGGGTGGEVAALLPFCCREELEGGCLRADAVNYDAATAILTDIQTCASADWAVNVARPVALTLPHAAAAAAAGAAPGMPALLIPRATCGLRQWMAERHGSLPRSLASMLEVARGIAAGLCQLHEHGCVAGRVQLDWVLMAGDATPLLCTWAVRHLLRLLPASALSPHQQQWRWWAPERVAALLTMTAGLRHDASLTKPDVCATVLAAEAALSDDARAGGGRGGDGGDGGASPAADVYAFGVLLWEMLCNGAVPFGAEEGVFGCTRELLREVCDSDLRPTTDLLPPTLPARAAIVALLGRCWNCTPASRPSAATLVSRLQEILADLAPPSAPPSLPVAAASAPLAATGAARAGGYVMTAAASAAVATATAACRRSPLPLLPGVRWHCPAARPTSTDGDDSDDAVDVYDGAAAAALRRELSEVTLATLEAAAEGGRLTHALATAAAAALHRDWRTPLVLHLALADAPASEHAARHGGIRREYGSAGEVLDAVFAFPRGAAACVGAAFALPPAAVAPSFVDELLAAARRAWLADCRLVPGAEDDALDCGLLPVLPQLVLAAPPATAAAAMHVMADLAAASPAVAATLAASDSVVAAIAAAGGAGGAGVVPALAYLETAMRSNTRAQSAVRECGGLPVLLAAVHHNHAGGGGDEVATAALRVFQLAVSSLPASRSAAGAAGAIPFLLSLLTPDAARTPALVLAACYALGDTMRRDSDNQQLLRAVGGLATLLSVLRTHSGDARVVEACCYALTYALDMHHESRAAAGEAGIVPLLRAATSRFGGSRVGVAEQAFMASRYCMFQCRAAQVAFGDGGAAGVWVPVLRAQLGVASVAEAACGALKQFALHTPSNPAQFFEAGGVALYVDLLRTHLGNAAVLEQAGRVGWNMLYTERKSSDLEAAFRSLGGVPLYLAGLARHAANSDVVEVVAAALHQVVNVSEKCRAEVEAAGGMATLVAVMRQQRGAVDALEQLCRCAWDACVSNKANELAFARAGAYPFLVDAVAAATPADDDFVEAALGCVTASAFSHEEAKKAFVAAGGLGTCRAALQVYDAYPRVVIRALQTVVTMARSLPAVQQAAYDAGLVEVVVAALRRHASVASVVRQAGLTLMALLAYAPAREAAVAAGATDLLLGAAEKHVETSVSAAVAAVNCLWHLLAGRGAYQGGFLAARGPARFLGLLRRGSRDADLCVAVAGALAIGSYPPLQAALAEEPDGPALLADMLVGHVEKEEDTVSRLVRSLSDIVGTHPVLVAGIATPALAAALARAARVPLRPAVGRSQVLSLARRVLEVGPPQVRDAFVGGSGVAAVLALVGPGADAAQVEAAVAIVAVCIAAATTATDGAVVDMVANRSAFAAAVQRVTRDASSAATSIGATAAAVRDAVLRVAGTDVLA